MVADWSDLVLGIHVVAGAVALGLGPLALVARGAQRPLAAGYQGAVALLISTALGLVAVDPARLWWLIPFAVGTQAAVIGGWWLGRVSIERSEARSEMIVGRVSIERSEARSEMTVGRRASGYRTPGRVRLMGGSYVSLITALLVVSWGNPLSWVLPSVVGVVIVETAAARAGRSQEVANAG